MMGNANWLLVWLDRLLPSIDIEGESTIPEPEREVVATTTNDHDLVSA